ncbi:MAG TPA: hypothetical protein VGR29_09375 [Thermomicrobiales bacterium]|nr:hypothetical protein [Thermomicrobiales bacterium]
MHRENIGRCGGSELTKAFEHRTVDDLGRLDAVLLTGDDQEFLRIRFGHLNTPGTSRNRLDGYKECAGRNPPGALPFVEENCKRDTVITFPPHGKSYGND